MCHVHGAHNLGVELSAIKDVCQSLKRLKLHCLADWLAGCMQTSSAGRQAARVLRCRRIGVHPHAPFLGSLSVEQVVHLVEAAANLVQVICALALQGRGVDVEPVSSIKNADMAAWEDSSTQQDSRTACNHQICQKTFWTWWQLCRIKLCEACCAHTTHTHTHQTTQ